MMTLLMTGASGYLGTTLVPMLIAEGFSVRAVDRFFFGRGLLRPHVNLQQIREDTRRLALEDFRGIDGVLDLAALSNDAAGTTFEKATWEINCETRIRTAMLAKQAGVRRYVLASSCSVYGCQERDVYAHEYSATNPLTVYAKANEAAEEGVLALADDGFAVTVLRLATLHGASPRMRYDLVVNRMIHDAWIKGRIRVMRDGTQLRPMLHVGDAARAFIAALLAPAALAAGQKFNVGSEMETYTVFELARIVAEGVSGTVELDYYGDPDQRSYRPAFDKIERLGWTPRDSLETTVCEITEGLAQGKLPMTSMTITCEWYRELERWHQALREMGTGSDLAQTDDYAVWRTRIAELEMYGGILAI